jgi:ABC-2 type transport system permease protein
VSRRSQAVRIGLARGWTEFRLSLRSPQDQAFHLVMATAVVLYLWFNRGSEVAGTTLLLPQVAMPSLLGGLVMFSAIIGPAAALSVERQDGTLLRSKLVPHGMLGYVSGQLLLQSLKVVPMLTVVLVPSLLLFDGLMHRGAGGWLTLLWVVVLGLLATLPFGIVIGSLVPGPEKLGTWGMLPIVVLSAISGIFVPVQQLWGWVQVIAQVFPMYWLGLGMRSAFLPGSAAVVEIGGSWRPLTTVSVLVVWGVAGMLLAPPVLRRMARRQSGARVAEGRDQALQMIR